MNKLSRTSRLLIVVLALDCLAAGLYVFLFRSLASSSGRIAEIRSELELKERERSSIEALRKNFDNTSALRAEIDSYFVDKDGVVDFIEYLESLARSRDLLVETQSVALSESEEGAIHEILRQTIEVEGSWADVTHFLSLVETLPFGIFVEEMSLNLNEDATKSKAGSWLGRVSFTAVKLK